MHIEILHFAIEKWPVLRIDHSVNFGHQHTANMSNIYSLYFNVFDVFFVKHF